MNKKLILRHRNFNKLGQSMKEQPQLLTILIFCLQFLILSLNSVFANDLNIADAKLVDKDTKNGTYDIEFDISWENSWFISGAPSPTANWDAAWVFAKYSTYSSETWSAWKHVSLLNTGNISPKGSQMSFGDTSGVYKGVFIYRSGAGTGTNNFYNAEIRWNYKADGVGDKDIVQVQVFGIEMVYIPTGNFYVGDDTARAESGGGTLAHFFDAGDSTDPRSSVLITSTQPYVSNVGDGSGTAGDITWFTDTAGSMPGYLPSTRTQLNANYPTGYNAFYLMKYEISSRQYTDFLNNITSTQAANRAANLFGNIYPIKLASNGKYGSDGNNNAGAWGSANYNLMNESDDAEWVACTNFLWLDFCAYADWAGLRPMTELEFEKACRGPNTPVAGEYAWGNTSITQVTSASQSNWKTASETYSVGNCHYLTAGFGGLNYPIRVGCIAASGGGTRVGSGAGYYGCMELSGNVWELIVSVTAGQTTPTLSSFAGTHGDGILSTNGNATNSDWPGFVSGEVTDDAGAGMRGGGTSSVDSVAVSLRVYASANSTFNFDTTRGDSFGGRFARTAP